MENKQNRQSVFDRFCAWFFAILQRFFIGRFFTSYDKANEKYMNSVKKKPRPRHMSRRIARALERNPLAGVFERLSEYLLKLSLRDYGIMMLLSGALVSLLYPINDMVLFINVTFEMFVYGIATAICAIPLLFSSRSLSTNILNSRLFCFLLFEYLGFDSERVRACAEQNRISTTNLSIVIGIGLGIISYFLTPVVTILVILALALAYATINTPEIGAVFSLVIIPFADIKVVQACMVYTFVCYFIKLLVGKRVFKLEYFDLFVVIAFVVMTIFGIDYTKLSASMTGVATNLMLLMAYFLYSNLIRSKEWFRRCIISLTTASLAVALYGIFQAIWIRIAQSFPILDPVFDFNEKITSTFLTNDSLAQFIAIALPFALVQMLSDTKEIKKFGGFLLATALIVTLVLTKSPTGYLAALIGFLMIIVFYNRSIVFSAIIVALTPIVLYFTLPDEIIARILSIGIFQGVSVSQKLAYLKDAFFIVIQKPLGISSADGAFSNHFPDLPGGYIDSLPLQFSLEYGILALVAFTVLIVMLTRLILSYAVKSKNGYRRINGCAGYCSAIAVLLSGVFTYSWSDKRIMLLFFIVIALSFAYIKIDREDVKVTEMYVDVTVGSLDITLSTGAIYDGPSKRRYVHPPKQRSKPREKERKIENPEKVEAKEFSKTEEIIIVVDKKEEETE
ncbi:MAG: hypothetical protein J6B34_03680 [Clostridia bacterium]|nr:hypothetical protein [Clostridia bacterium]